MNLSFFIFLQILFIIFVINLSYKANNNTLTMESVLLSICAPYIYFYYIYSNNESISLLLNKN